MESSNSRQDVNSTEAVLPRNLRRLLSEDYQALASALSRKDAPARLKFWESLPREHYARPFSGEDVDHLRAMLLIESEWGVRTAGMVYLDGVLHSSGPIRDSSEKIRDWLFQAFAHSRADRSDTGRSSLVLTVLDKTYGRDVQALVRVARLLPSDRYPQTVFQQVALDSPDWSEVDFGQVEAVCFIGRLGMFENCPIMKSFPTDLRFSIERDLSGAPDQYSFVRQNRPTAGPRPYQTTQRDSSRDEYAIVQRFVAPFDGRNVTVVVIAGATSLGTLGAAQWITEFGWSTEKRNEYARVAGLDNIDSSTRIEALLEVKSNVHVPPRPWRPRSTTQGLYLNKSRNLIKVPSCISVATKSGRLQTAEDVQYLLFDEDEVDFGGSDQAAAVAVCVKYCLDKRREMTIDDVVDDRRLWPDGIWPGSGVRVTFFREHLQKRSFNGIVEVGKESLQLKLDKCKIKVI